MRPLTGTGWSLSASAGHTERAPAYYELFANGVHIATAAYERGEPTLGVERSVNGELGASWQQGGHSRNSSIEVGQEGNSGGMPSTIRGRIYLKGADGLSRDAAKVMAFATDAQMGQASFDHIDLSPEIFVE